MSSAGVAAKMALKSITAVSAGDPNIGQTAQAGLDPAASGSGSVAPAAGARGPYLRGTGESVGNPACHAGDQQQYRALSVTAESQG